MARRGMSRRRFLAGVGAVAVAGAAGTARGATEKKAAASPASGAMRFGVMTHPAVWADVLAFWQDAEGLGFDTAFVTDHFMSAVPGPPEAERCHEAWTMLAALAAKTERIRVGVLVTGNTYRHPAVLAKMAATVDHVSRGRLILGLGAGWLEREHVAYGIPFYTKGGRARRLGEAVEVVKRLFTQERSTWQGKAYALKDAPLEPKPLQKPHPPILIGGMGPKLVQPIAAQHAQIWHFIVPGNDPAAVRAAIESFDRLCGEVGRDPKEVEKATSIDPRLEPAELRAKIGVLRDAGVRHVILLPPAADHRAVLRRFAKEVMPEFQPR